MYERILILVIAFGFGLQFQAGWMIDFAPHHTVVLPFGLNDYNISGSSWFILAIATACAGYIIIVIGTVLLGYIPRYAWLPYIFFALYGISLILVAINFERLENNVENITIYGQYWNLLFYWFLLISVFGTFLSEVY